MALRINTNVAALNAHRNMIATDYKLSSSLERLSTGLRINKAADDASGMAIADSLKAQHLGIGQAVRNANDGISMVQTADGALQESINIVNTIKTKAIQAASDGQTTETRKAIQADIDKLMEELDVIARTTSFNGQKLLSGAFTNKKIQIGAFSNETASISIGSTESTKTGHISTASLSLASEAGGEVQLTITSSITGDKLTLNKIDIQSNNSAENGMGALADEVNRYTAVTGIKANAIVATTTSTAIQAGSTGNEFSINGINIGAITVSANDSTGALVSAINGKTTEHGVTATMGTDGTMTLTSTDGRAILVEGSVSGVMGSTGSQMSTQGYLALTQAGTSQFQINGIGAGATGADITITGDVTTADDSILSSGSTIEYGSRLNAGSIIGGDALVELSVGSTQLDYELKSGSTLYATTTIAAGTVLGGSITLAGDATDDTAGGMTTLSQDMLLTAGSKLAENSFLGVGTVITTQFSTSASGSVVTYNVGDTLTSQVELSRDVTLDADMVLKYDSTAADNSIIKSGSIINTGSEAGANLEIGYTYAATGNVVVTSGATTTGPVTLTADFTYTAAASLMTIKAGTYLADATVLYLTAGAGTTWQGPTLETTTGTLKTGDAMVSGGSFTLSGGQVISADITTDTAGNSVIRSGSILMTGTDVGNGGFTSGNTTILSTATLSQDMTLENGSELAAGSQMLAGSELGNDTFIRGGAIDDGAKTDVTTTQRTELKAGSLLQSGSIYGEGSTIGGTTTISGATTLSSDMTVNAGTLLADNTLLVKGTVITQDMTLDATNGNGTTTIDVKAGDVLTSNQVTNGNTTLSESMTLLEDSILATASELSINTANAGTVGLSDTLNQRLSDLSVLTQEGAQFAIDIAEAALKDLDETRSGLGSVQNQLTSTIANLSVTKTNIQASESAIRDVDFAEEASIFSKLQLLSQTGSYALAQANAASQNILSLLQ